MSCGDYVKDVDEYIAKSGDFAKPILEKIRKVVHAACPEVEEKMRWSFPHFDHKGMMISMAAFKQHCAMGFWKESIMADPERLFSKDSEGMGSLGKITSLKDLPSEKVLIKYVKEAVRLNDEGVLLPKRKSANRAAPLTVPAYFSDALKKNKKALKAFEDFSTSHRNEYVEWITDAKQEKTRERRIEQAIEWLSDGKSRNWKYEK